jgi:GNAT superfamily N-acetyltransferase
MIKQTNLKDILVRPAMLGDALLIADFQIQMALETEAIRLDPLVVGAGVREVFRDERKGRYFVAEHQGLVVGCLLTIPEWSDWRNGTVLWIHSVYVRPAARRLGVFSQLYANVKNLVEESSDLRGLRLYVDRTNKSAAAVYASLGMSNEHYELFEWMSS